ncbi:hypothetical protein K437DRAFT_260418 [Tilletiaria anomala UBC 951]|uniref:Uncharacterized protein n=1 Tax=Tilletiaria anomala (strain ATCC 24038 / CBS 436.72 / UBC 951) TaxID=1037660 RepID=A0A066V058_TILAU|nr:uncharacterized protein K437DRAFT_260418 [Tilletiaria anomala UBC 951]KDN35107.1 hypothetical protein K437DRAFT_260418 [Tilletiaria anomala UBC 951]
MAPDVGASMASRDCWGRTLKEHELRSMSRVGKKVNRCRWMHALRAQAGISAGSFGHAERLTPAA